MPNPIRVSLILTWWTHSSCLDPATPGSARNTSDWHDRVTPSAQ